MVGVNEYSNEEISVGVFESKADVLAYYRSQKMTEAILNYLDYMEIKRK